MARSDAGRPPASRRLGIGLLWGAVSGLIAVALGLPALLSVWRHYPLIALGIAVLCGLLSLLGLARLVAFSTLALVALWLAVVLTPLTSVLMRRVGRADPLPEGGADVIFVFSSSLQPDGDPTTPAMTRLLRGLELLGEGRAPRLVLSELPPPSPSYRALAASWMQHLGVRGELLAVGPILNTRDEAVALASLCRERGWRRVLAVSGPSHLRRAAAALEHEGLAAWAVPAVEPRWDTQRLALSDDRVLSFGGLLHDLVGYQVYRLRGWVGR